MLSSSAVKELTLLHLQHNIFFNHTFYLSPLPRFTLSLTSLVIALITLFLTLIHSQPHITFKLLPFVTSLRSPSICLLCTGSLFTVLHFRLFSVFTWLPQSTVLCLCSPAYTFICSLILPGYPNYWYVSLFISLASPVR